MAVLSQNWLLGTLVIAAIVFVETGLAVMPFLPGDSLLFTAGAFLGLASISPLIPMAIVCVAAIAGDATNYAIGRSSLGHQIIRRGWVKPRHLKQTRSWFDRFGGPTITIGRFVPIVRTLAPFMRPRGNAGSAVPHVQHHRRYRLVRCADAGGLLAGSHRLGAGTLAMVVAGHRGDIGTARRDPIREAIQEQGVGECAYCWSKMTE